jgi:hypothetical protein
MIVGKFSYSCPAHVVNGSAESHEALFFNSRRTRGSKEAHD